MPSWQKKKRPESGDSGRCEIFLSDGDYFGASFFGLLFSHTLPSALAFTQHLCSQSLPAAFALSQQDSALAMERPPRRTRAQTIALMDFMFCLSCRPDSGRRSLFVVLNLRIIKATQPQRHRVQLPGHYSPWPVVDNPDLAPPAALANPVSAWGGVLPYRRRVVPIAERPLRTLIFFRINAR